MGKLTAPNNITILVVDDEPDLLSLVADEFKMKGFSTLSAENISQAIEIISKFKVDAILSDMRMNDGDGISFFEYVKKHSENKIPFFLMSGFSDISTEAASKLGVRLLIQKPFFIPELVEMIKTNLKNI